MRGLAILSMASLDCIHTHTGYSRRSHAHSCLCALCVYASIYIDQCYCMTEVTRAEECTQDMFIVGVGCT